MKEEEIMLQELGFTQAEAKVYLTLLKLGPVKVGQIIEKSGLQSSTIHNTLHSLIDKGFVRYVLRGKIKIYQSVEPNLILQEFKEKEQKFEEIVPKLESMQQLTKEKPQAEIYEGTSGIITMLNELIQDSKPNDNYYFFAVDVSGLNKEIQKFFERYDKKRENKKLIVRGLARKELKPLFSKRKYLKTKYVNFPIPSNISICNDKMVLITWGEKPIGMLVKSKQLIQSQINFFNELWKTATP
jgi:sugar-specific transcriptional regulator TrmB